MAKSIGIHATTKRHETRIKAQGMKPQPFWHTRRWVRSPKKFRLKYPAFVNVVSGKDRAQVLKSVYDSLRSANINLTGSSRQKFRIKDLRLFLIDLEKSRISKERQRPYIIYTAKSKKSKETDGFIEEVETECGPHAVRQFSLSKEEITKLSKATKKIEPEKANQYIAEFITEKIMKELK